MLSNPVSLGGTTEKYLPGLELNDERHGWVAFAMIKLRKIQSVKKIATVEGWSIVLGWD